MNTQKYTQQNNKWLHDLVHGEPKDLDLGLQCLRAKHPISNLSLSVNPLQILDPEPRVWWRDTISWQRLKQLDLDPSSQCCGEQAGSWRGMGGKVLHIPATGMALRGPFRGLQSYSRQWHWAWGQEHIQVFSVWKLIVGPSLQWDQMYQIEN